MPRALLLLLLLASTAQSQVVPGNLSIAPNSGPFPGVNLVLSVNKTPACNDSICNTRAGFQYADGSLRLVWTNLDEGSQWYRVQPGDIFNAATFTNYQEFVGQTFVVGSDFFLGVRTGIGVANGQVRRDVHGWAHIKESGGTFTMLGAAASYGSGIIVGSLAVPEPSTLILAALAAVAGTRSVRAGGRLRGRAAACNA